MLRAERTPPRASGVTLSPMAWAVANETYQRAVEADAEAGLCVMSGAYRWGWAADGKMWVEIVAFATHGPQAAQTFGGTRYSLLWRNYCGDTLPALHTHIVKARGMPSKCDVQGAARRPRVPFYLIQFARDSIMAFYVVPGEHHILADDSTNYCAR